MKARVIKPFPGVPDGEAHPRDYAVGDAVHGSLAEVAVREGWATEDPLDHDGNGKAGGSLPGSRRRRKGKA